MSFGRSAKKEEEEKKVKVTREPKERKIIRRKSAQSKPDLHSDTAENDFLSSSYGTVFKTL